MKLIGLLPGLKLLTNSARDKAWRMFRVDMTRSISLGLIQLCGLHFWYRCP